MMVDKCFYFIKASHYTVNILLFLTLFAKHTHGAVGDQSDEPICACIFCFKCHSLCSLTYDNYFTCECMVESLRWDLLSALI